MKRICAIAVVLLAPVVGFSQAARMDSQGPVQSVTSLNGVSLLKAEPSASITYCAYPATGGIASGASGPCTNKASVCPDSTLVGCTTGAPNNPVSADAQGNFGAWLNPGIYQYTVCPQSGVCRGPYNAWTPFGSTLAGVASIGNVTFTGTISGVAKFYSGTPSQANWPGTATVVPTQIDIENGSASTPTTGQYLSNPSLFISRYDATTIAACESGLLNLCAAPVARIAYSNTSTTTMSSAYGLILEGSRFAANTKGTNLGHNYTHGIGVALGDAATPNIAAMTGADLNITVTGLPAQCHFGTAGSGNTNCARLAESSESNVTNSSGTDAVVDASAIGNYIVGHSIQHSGLNDSSFALITGTGTASHGFKGGISFGGLSGPTGLTFAETGISNKPDLAILIGTQGKHGINCGSGSLKDLSPVFTPAANWTLGNTSVSCILLDALRGYNTTGTAQSNILQYRTATGATTYQNWRNYLTTDSSFHWQTDIVTPNTFVDAMVFFPNLTAANNTLALTGILRASNYLQLKYDGTNSFQITGTPTGGVNAWTLQNLAGGSDTLVGRGTTDTFTGTKTFSAQIVSSVATGTAPFSVASTTNVANLNASSLGGATFSAPGAIGGGTPSTIAATSITVGGDTAFTKAPRFTFTCQIASLNGVASYCAFVTEQPITVTRLVIQQITGSTGCATFPVVSAFNNTGSAILTSVTESAATAIDGGAVSVAVATAQTVMVRVTTAGVTCSPTAANVNVTIQYKMQ